MLTITDPRDDRATRRGKTMIIDVGPDMSGWTGRHGLADLLEAMGNYIDAAKIATLNAVSMPDSYLTNTISQYRNAEIPTFAGGGGGLLFEYTYLKNDIDGLIERLRFLGLGGIEVSENYITLTNEERDRFIGWLVGAGFDVVFEYGHKFPDSPIDLGELERIIRRTKEVGAHHVIMEQGEFDLLAEERPDELESMKVAPWMDDIFIEVDTGEFPQPQLALIERFGPQVNIAPAHVYKLEMLRRGRGRWIDYPFFRDMVAAKRK
jgi:phosphosulfolactate synthase (CoM biosynthesis protein A)